MALLVFVFLLFIASADVAAPLTVTTSCQRVTVMRGEPLELLCVIETEPGEIVSEVSWYRGLEVPAYASVDIPPPPNCTSFADYFCAEGHTTDSRGNVRYQKIASGNATLALIIENSDLTDNTTFSCGAVLTNDSREPNRSENMHVTVCDQFPEDPMCKRSTVFNASSQVPFALICEAALTNPVVSLQWATSLGGSSRIPLSNNTTISDGKVVNTLLVENVNNSYYSSTFTCYLQSEACPSVERSCYTGPFVINANPPSMTTATELVPISKPDPGKSTSPSDNTSDCCNDDHEISSPSPDPTGTPPVSPHGNTNIVLIAAIAGAAGFVVLVLVVSACLLSRRKAKRRRNDAASRDINFHVYVNTATSISPENDYDETPHQREDGTGGNSATGAVLPPAAYTSSPVIGLQDQTTPGYAVLDPFMTSSRETSGDF